jgi:hypothetical protein
VIANAGCYTENQRVTLTGTAVGMTGRTVEGDGTYRYAALKLDAPICYHDADFGDVPRATVVSITPAVGGLGAGLAWVGQRITLEGAITHIEVGTQPPSPSALLLWEAKPRT